MPPPPRKRGEGSALLPFGAKAGFVAHTRAAALALEPASLLPVVPTRGTEFMPILEDNPHYRLWEEKFTSVHKYFELAVAEDYVRHALLKPILAHTVRDSRFNLHLMGAQADRLIALSKATSDELHSLLREHRELAALELAALLSERLGGALTAHFPLLPGQKDIFTFVVRFARSWSRYGRTRILLDFPWSAELGFDVTANAALLQARDIPPLWGVRIKVPKDFAEAISELRNVSGRTILQNGRGTDLLFGPMAFLNCACEAHANVVSHSMYGLLVDGRVKQLVKEDFTGAIPHQGRIPAGVPLRFYYGDSYAKELPCMGCASAIRPNVWARRHAEAAQDIAAHLRAERTASRARSALLRTTANPTACLPPGAPHLYPCTTTPRRRLGAADEGGDLLVARSVHNQNTSTLFTLASLNVDAAMAGLKFDIMLAEYMYQMRRHDISVLGLQETGRVRAAGMFLDKEGLGEHVSISPDGTQVQYMGLWNFPPPTL